MLAGSFGVREMPSSAEKPNWMPTVPQHIHRHPKLSVGGDYQAAANAEAIGIRQLVDSGCRKWKQRPYSPDTGDILQVHHQTEWQWSDCVSCDGFVVRNRRQHFGYHAWVAVTFMWYFFFDCELKMMKFLLLFLCLLCWMQHHRLRRRLYWPLCAHSHPVSSNVVWRTATKNCQFVACWTTFVVSTSSICWRWGVASYRIKYAVSLTTNAFFYISRHVCRLLIPSSICIGHSQVPPFARQFKSANSACSSLLLMSRRSSRRSSPPPGCSVCAQTTMPASSRSKSRCEWAIKLGASPIMWVRHYIDPFLHNITKILFCFILPMQVYGASSGATYIEEKSQCLRMEWPLRSNRKLGQIAADVKIVKTSRLLNLRRTNQTTLTVNTNLTDDSIVFLSLTLLNHLFFPCSWWKIQPTNKSIFDRHTATHTHTSNVFSRWIQANLQSRRVLCLLRLGLYSTKIGKKKQPNTFTKTDKRNQ